MACHEKYNSWKATGESYSPLGAVRQVTWYVAFGQIRDLGSHTRSEEAVHVKDAVCTLVYMVAAVIRWASIYSYNRCFSRVYNPNGSVSRTGSFFVTMVK